MSVVIFIALFIAGGTAASRAQPPPARTQGDAVPGAAGYSARVLSLSRRLMSPFCPGLTLASCSSRGAAEWLVDVRVWVAEGATDDDIIARLQSRTPAFDISPDPGGNWNWGIGVVAIASITLLMGGIAYSTARHRRQDRNSTAASTVPVWSEQEHLDLEERLDEELALVD